MQLMYLFFWQSKNIHIDTVITLIDSLRLKPTHVGSIRHYKWQHEYQTCQPKEPRNPGDFKTTKNPDNAIKEADTAIKGTDRPKIGSRARQNRESWHVWNMDVNCLYNMALIGNIFTSKDNFI